MAYTPYAKAKKILDRAMEHIRSVDYSVSVRWVFYRLLQESLYKAKSDYTNFVLLTSRARKNWYDGWNPETLADETRAMDVFISTGARPDPDVDDLIEDEITEALDTIEYHKHQAEHYSHYFGYEVDGNYYQDYFCVIMFEARAMHEQFKQYTNGLTLCPCGGQPSIPFKWKVAKHIEDRCTEYQKPCRVFYFGDLDDAGFKIFNSVRTDITEWCSAEVEFLHCGLNEHQVKQYEVPENFEHPGSWQWEALTDEQARDIIQEALGEYYDFDAKDRATTKGEQISDAVTFAVNSYLEQNKE